MKYLWLILLPCLAFGKTPVDFKKWQIDDTTFSKQIGGSVRNYEKPDKAWAQIVNDFEIEGDSVVYVDQSVLRSRVNKNGVCKVMLTWNDAEYTITQKLLGIGWLKISTRQSLWIDSTMNWSNFSVDSNIVKWTGVSPGVDYRVLKDNGRVAHGIFFKPAFLDSAVTLYDQRADSLDIALANVMVYTLSSNIDDADSAIGDVPKRRLKDFGYYTFNLRDQQLRFPGSDTLPRIPVRQYWERRGTKIICIEYVMMRRVKQVHETYPTATIWHNDSKTIEGTTNVEDMYLQTADGNYGGHISLRAYGTGYVPLVRVKNVASELGVGATISACVCSLYLYGYGGGSANLNAYSIFKPWGEGTLTGQNPADAPTGEGVATFSDWSNDDEEWTTGGCNSGDDGGSDNSGDGTGADRKATAEDTESLTSVGWYAWNITTALAQAWYDGTKNEEGLQFSGNYVVSNYFYSTESAEAEKPFWVFTYTTDGEPEIFGYDTVGASWLTFTDYTIQVIPVRLSPPQGGAIRIDSVLVYAKKAIAPITGGYLKGVVYSYNAVTAECSLQVVSDDSVWVDSDTPQWWNLPMPSDTLRACKGYMVGFQGKNHDGISQVRVYYDDGPAGDMWFVGDSDFDPSTTLAGATTFSTARFSVKAYYTVVSTDTLILLRSAGDDSTGWYDSYINDANVTTNYGSDANTWWGSYSDEEFFTLARLSALVNVVPSGKQCDSAMYCMVIAAQTGTDTIWPEVHRVLSYWTEADVTWNKRLFIGDWTTPGALSDGNDRLAAAEQADDVVRRHIDFGWSDYIDGDSIATPDTVLAQLDPNTINDISDETISNYGWVFQYDVPATDAVVIKAWSRDYNGDATQKSQRRPFMRIYCSDIPAVVGGGQFMMISEGR